MGFSIWLNLEFFSKMVIFFVFFAFFEGSSLFF